MRVQGPTSKSQSQLSFADVDFGPWTLDTDSFKAHCSLPTDLRLAFAFGFASSISLGLGWWALLVLVFSRAL